MTNNPPSSRIQPGEYGFPFKLKARYDNFICGDWVAPVDGEYYKNLTPVTGQLLCEVASSGTRDIDLALDAGAANTNLLAEVLGRSVSVSGAA